jgi:hypothetical protein
MALEVPVSGLEGALREPCVGKWLSNLTVETRPTYLSNLRGFLDWLWQKPEWKGKMPSELLAFQEEVKGRQRFILPDLIIDHVQAKGGTYKSMTTQVSHLRTFFTNNRVELPPIGNWHPNPTREPVGSTLTLEQVHLLIRLSHIVELQFLRNLRQVLSDWTQDRRWINPSILVKFDYSEHLIGQGNERIAFSPAVVDFQSATKLSQASPCGGRVRVEMVHLDGLFWSLRFFCVEQGTYVKKKILILVNEITRMEAFTVTTTIGSHEWPVEVAEVYAQLSNVIGEAFAEGWNELVDALLELLGQMSRLVNSLPTLRSKLREGFVHLFVIR